MSPVSRRTFMAATGIAALAGALVPQPWAVASDLPVGSKQLFDSLDAEAPNFLHVTTNNEQGFAAWSHAAWLKAYLVMYEALGATAEGLTYLDHFITNADALLQNRDSTRAVSDYRGLSNPVWRSMGAATCSVAVIRDAAGNPLFEVRSATPGANATATITSGGSGKFGLQVTGAGKTTRTWTDLTLDSSDARYAVPVVYTDFPLYQGNDLWITLKDLRAARNVADTPATGSTALSSLPYAYAVHTGILCHPLAKFVRLVQGNATLTARYASQSAIYRQAAIDGMQSHEADVSTVNGANVTYRILKGAPAPFDGCVLPTNMKDAMTATFVELARTESDPTGLYHVRAKALATSSRNQMAFSMVSGVRVVDWTYWPTYSEVYNGYAPTGTMETDISSYNPRYGGNHVKEDVGHAALTVDSAVAAWAAGIYYTSTDFEAMAATLRTRVIGVKSDLTTPGAYTYVDGTGPIDTDGQLGSPAQWLPVTPMCADRPALVTAVRNLFVARQASLQRNLLGNAHLFWALTKYPTP